MENENNVDRTEMLAEGNATRVADDAVQMSNNALQVTEVVSQVSEEAAQTVENMPQTKEDIPQVSENATQVQTMPKKPANKLLLIGLPVLAAIAVISGVLVYNNTPAQRFNKQMDLGVKSLLELDYETAKASFNKAIEIDNTDLEAYLGLMKAYSGSQDKSGMADTYDAAVNIIKENMNTYTDENKAYALEIVRYVREVYGDNVEKEIESTALAYAMFPDNEEFRQVLVDDYFTVGVRRSDDKDFAKAIEYFEKALELDADNEDIIERRNRAVKDCISSAIDSRDYDLAKALSEQYKNIVPGIDADFIYAEIDELIRIKEIEAQNHDYMAVVYEVMATEDYISMLDMYNSDECQDFLHRMTKEVYYYFPDNNAAKSGTGAACYNDDGSYYFYYGNYENGSREGYGTTFVGDFSGYYTYFKGNWSKDAPNGDGEEIRKAEFVDGGEYIQTINGSLINGYWDGSVSRIINDAGINFDVSFSAIDGIPTKDRTSEWKSATENNFSIPRDCFIYAYDRKNFGYGGWNAVWSWIPFGRKIGTIGY